MLVYFSLSKKKSLNLTFRWKKIKAVLKCESKICLETQSHLRLKCAVDQCNSKSNKLYCNSTIQNKTYNKHLLSLSY